MPNGLAGSAQVSYPLWAPSGTAAAPSYSFAAYHDLGLYVYAANQLAIAATGLPYLRVGPGFTEVQGSFILTNSLGTPEVYLGSGGADILVLSHGTSPQTFRIYGTNTGPKYLGLGHTGTVGEARCDGNLNVYIDGNQTLTFGGLNSEILVRSMGSIAHSGSMFTITAATGDIQIGPYGVAGTMNLTTNGSTRWTVTAAGDLSPGADNSYDIGPSGGNRVRNVRAAGTVIASTGVYSEGYVGAVDQFSLIGTVRIKGPSDGVLVVYNEALTSFNRLCFGGTTSSFPAIERNGSGLRFLTADAAAYCNVYGNYFWADTSAGFVNAVANAGMYFKSFDSGAPRIYPGLSGTSLWIGNDPSATPGAYIVTIGGAARPTTDVDVGGGNGTIRSGLGTGTGTASQILIQTPDLVGSGSGAQTYTTRLTIQASGISAGVSVAVPAASYFYWTTRSLLASPADGVITLGNNVLNDFGRLQFGGTTASYPSIKRNGAALDLRLADDSGYTDLQLKDAITSSVYTNTIIAVAANNTYISVGAGGITLSLVNTSATLALQVTSGATLATFGGGGYLDMYEITAPSAPAANTGRLYFEDNGAGKTRLMCLFATGSAQQLAIEP